MLHSVNQDELHALLLALDQQGLQSPADIDIDKHCESIVAAENRKHAAVGVWWNHARRSEQGLGSPHASTPA